MRQCFSTSGTYAGSMHLLLSTVYSRNKNIRFSYHALVNKCLIFKIIDFISFPI